MGATKMGCLKPGFLPLKRFFISAQPQVFILINFCSTTVPLNGQNFDSTQNASLSMAQRVIE